MGQSCQNCVEYENSMNLTNAEKKSILRLMQNKCGFCQQQGKFTFIEVPYNNKLISVPICDKCSNEKQSLSVEQYRQMLFDKLETIKAIPEYEILTRYKIIREYASDKKFWFESALNYEIQTERNHERQRFMSSVFNTGLAALFTLSLYVLFMGWVWF